MPLYLATEKCIIFSNINFSNNNVFLLILELQTQCCDIYSACCCFVSPLCLKKRLSPSWFPGPLALTMFPSPLLKYCLNIKWKGCIINVLFWGEHNTVSFSLNFDQLWLSVTVSISHIKSLLWWMMITTYFCGTKDKYLESTLRLYWFRKVSIVYSSLGSMSNLLLSSTSGGQARGMIQRYNIFRSSDASVNTLVEVHHTKDWEFYLEPTTFRSNII